MGWGSTELNFLLTQAVGPLSDFSLASIGKLVLAALSKNGFTEQ